jgi:hypothetical protein
MDEMFVFHVSQKKQNEDASDWGAHWPRNVTFMREWNA